MVSFDSVVRAYRCLRAHSKTSDNHSMVARSSASPLKIQNYSDHRFLLPVLHRQDLVKYTCRYGG